MKMSFTCINKLFQLNDNANLKNLEKDSRNMFNAHSGWPQPGETWKNLEFYDHLFQTWKTPGILKIIPKTWKTPGIY